MRKRALFIGLMLLFSTMPITHAAPVEIKYFYSTGCSHCRAVTGILDDVEEEYGDVVNIDRINVNLADNQGVWSDYSSRFSLSGVPVLIINDEYKLAGDIRITYDNLVDLIEEVISGISVKGDELYNSGVDEMGSGEFEAAIDYFEQALEIYQLAGDDNKVELTEEKIQDCHDFIEAREIYFEAEVLYADERYEEAIPLYEQALALYQDLGKTSLINNCEVRLRACHFFVTYEDAITAYEAKEWEDAITLFEEAKQYTSKKETLDSINEYISFCETQLSALDLYQQAEGAFTNGNYAEAKQLYNDAATLIADPELKSAYNAKAALCDKFIVAHDTYDYGVSLYEQGDNEQAIAVLKTAQEKFTELEDTEMAESAQSYADKAQQKIDEAQQQQEEEQQERRRLIIAAGIAGVIVVIALLVLLLTRRRPVVGGMDESEHASEHEEHE
jgi:tetratricopeptide (TPR) repeat protein